MPGHEIAEGDQAAPALVDWDGELVCSVRSLIAQRLRVAESRIVPEARFLEDLGADSLDVVELALAFEETFSVAIPDRDLDHLETVGGAVAQLARLLAGRR
jgi:acyl carrier protein